MQNISHTVSFGENMYGYCVCLEYVQKKPNEANKREAADKVEWKKSIGIQFIYFSTLFSCASGGGLHFMYMSRLRMLLTHFFSSLPPHSCTSLFRYADKIIDMK
jgi:hypothetical protein